MPYIHIYYETYDYTCPCGFNYSCKDKRQYNLINNLHEKKCSKSIGIISNSNDTHIYYK